MIEIIVKRVRQSVTQGEAHVFINGRFATNFADEISMVKPNEKTYGPIMGGYASKKPDKDFIKGLLCHPYEEVYDYHRILEKIIDEIPESEVEKW